MRRFLIPLIAVALFTALPASAQAAFGLNDFGVSFTEADGTPSTQAGSHPYQATFSFELNKIESKKGWDVVDGALRDLDIFTPLGFAGDPTAIPRCTTLSFLSIGGGGGGDPCADSTALGYIQLTIGNGEVAPPVPGGPFPLYNLYPEPGAAARLGFWLGDLPVTVNATLSDSPPYRILSSLSNASQLAEVHSTTTTLWGTPADPAHDPLRGECLALGPGGTPASSGNCPANIPQRPFITMPRSCQGPLETTFRARSWWTGSSAEPGPPATFEETVEAEGPLGEALGMGGCSKLGYAPRIDSQPTASSAESGAGLDFSLDFKDEGLASPSGLANSDTKKAIITLPKGVTVNPSVGEGLGVCTPAQLEREKLRSAPGEGCPNASKLGTLSATSPLVEEAVEGSIFLAQQDDPQTTAKGAENPFDSLIALYFVLRNPTLGVIVKLPLKVEPDPTTGQLVTVLDEIPQLPLSHFEAHLRSGARAPLITPPTCGAYATEARFYPWAKPATPTLTTASFRVSSGVGGGPCPPAGVPPFHPEFGAGAINNNAGAFSPFHMRLIRSDGEQDMTRFSSVLPPGELGSLKGVGRCPDSAVAAAKAKSGRQEIASPSCPQSSEIGHTLAGAGVGEALTYVPGNLYLAGPYKGDPLSVISITPAVAGPFDAGTVVVRLALDLNPRTAEVQVDGAASDPIPHILKGIVLKLRDLRVYVDRPNFTLNPTSCEESSAKATLFGSFLDVLNPADDVPINLSSRYQAANCGSLGFKPRLSFKLKGGTKRGGHPGLLSTYRPRPGDANAKGLVVRLPRSAFLDQAHIRTICTRVQFAADACPAGAQYGFIKAFTPLLDEPLQGPVYLRSSSHKLPDLVFDLHGLVDIEVATRIDSVRGGIRARIDSIPDAPISKVLLRMQGAKKGLIVNSRDLCAAPARADVGFTGHNGKRHEVRPVMRAECGGGGSGSLR